MQTIKPPFENAQLEAAFIDSQIKNWRDRLAAIPEGRCPKTRIRLLNLISDGTKAATDLRVSYSQHSQGY